VRERHDLGAVEAAQLGAEPLLLEVERRDPHHALGGDEPALAAEVLAGGFVRSNIGSSLCGCRPYD
jgi:hypothetical protein